MKVSKTKSTVTIEKIKKRYAPYKKVIVERANFNNTAATICVLTPTLIPWLRVGKVETTSEGYYISGANGCYYKGSTMREFAKDVSDLLKWGKDNNNILKTIRKAGCVMDTLELFKFNKKEFAKLNK